jgi:phosphate transport system protein
MERHFQRELDKLKKNVLSLGAMVEEAVRQSVKALQTSDNQLASKVIDDDKKIDLKEVDIEEECLKILALHQPVAIDLRIISSMIKINNDLERVGDEAVNIAQRSIVMSKQTPIDMGIDHDVMAGKVETMLKNSLDALVNLDTALAYQVCLADDEIDDINRSIYNRAQETIQHNPDQVEYLVGFLLVSHHIERIADHATNIAEEVLYIVEGKIHRHAKIQFG